MENVRTIPEEARIMEMLSGLCVYRGRDLVHI